MKLLSLLLLLFCTSVKGQQPTEKDLIGGCWFVPHSAGINIRFYEDGKFDMNDFNVKKNESEELHGKYVIEGTRILLTYDDRPRQWVKLIYNKVGKAYTIKVAAPSPKYSATMYVHGECF
jgi:hypothetical protein